jgi:hypothetical protein
MMKPLLPILLLCLFITGCTPKQSTDIVVTTIKSDEAMITVRTITGEGPDLTPTCPPVENITWRVDSPNPYLKGETYEAIDLKFVPKPNNHSTPFVSNYTSY